MSLEALGQVHHFGNGTTQDYFLAHMYFNLAAANGSRSAARDRESLLIKMTSSQIEKAEDLARGWVAKH